MSKELADRIVLEKAIVKQLIEHLATKGFKVWRTFDGEQFIRHSTDEGALGLCHEVEELSLRFAPAKLVDAYWAARKGVDSVSAQQLITAEHGVLLVFGNGADVISDWNCTRGDPDGFDAAMDTFPLGAQQ